jgi:sec-independent protein translocase protein TatC
MLEKLRRRPGKKKPTFGEMTLAGHLQELRQRIVVCVIVFVVASVAAFIFYPQLLDVLRDPYCQVSHPCTFYVTGPLDGLSLRVKLAAYGGAFVTAPVVLWELWRFVTPGLHAREKRYAVPFIVASVILFISGAALALFTFSHALKFLAAMGGPSLKQIYTPNSYLSLILAVIVIFGVTFEFPVILVSLELAGVVTPAKLASWRRWAIFLIVLVAAVITPSGDPFSMMALAVPLYVFYEVSILIGRLVRRRSAVA